MSPSFFLEHRRCICSPDHRVQFISCSATLANPQEYMTKIFGLEAGAIEVISQDGAPSASKDYVVWNPPFIDPLQPAMGRRSSISEASRVMRYLMKKGIRVILFCKVCMHICNAPSQGADRCWSTVLDRFAKFASSWVLQVNFFL